MTPLETAALAYYQARKSHEAARAKLREYRQEHGSCQWSQGDVGSIDEVPECFRQSHVAIADWCAICRGSEPLHQEYRSAASAVGQRMRALLRECEKVTNGGANDNGSR